MAFCSMTDPEKPALTADFPQATREDWRKLVDAALKGVPFERLRSKTYDNLSFEPLYGRAAAAKPLTGRPSGAAWTLMQRADHPEAAAANAQALADLENGATGLVLVFAGSPSANGFGLDPSPEALARVLEGVHLDAGVAIDLDLSAASRDVMSKLAELIKRRGAAPSAVDLRTGFNPIGDFAASGSRARSWNDMSPDFAGAVGEGRRRRFPRTIRRCRWAHHPQCRRLGGAGARLRARRRRCLSAGARSKRHGARRRAPRHLFPAFGGCRAVFDHGQIPRAAQTLGARRSRPAG